MNLEPISDIFGKVEDGQIFSLDQQGHLEPVETPSDLPRVFDRARNLAAEPPYNVIVYRDGNDICVTKRVTIEPNDVAAFSKFGTHHGQKTISTASDAGSKFVTLSLQLSERTNG